MQTPEIDLVGPLERPLEGRAFAEALARLAESLHGQDSVDATLGRLLQAATSALGCSEAGVIFTGRGQRIETVAATSDLVAKLDLIQLELGEGPDIDVLDDDRQLVVVDDTHRDERWPAWGAKVAAAGIRSMLGVRLRTDGRVMGSLNFYDPAPAHFDLHDQEVAPILARHAAIALDHARDSENLWKAIDARKVIGQAQGILMERFDMDADRAFSVLSRYSQDHNVKLHAVAQQLVETRNLPRRP